MRWYPKTIILFLILIIVVSGYLSALVVEADPGGSLYQTVLVDFTPDIGQPSPPTDFQLIYVSDNQVDIDWIKGVNTSSTLIKVAVGSYPEGPDDGYTVYSGNGTSFSDFAVSLDETATEMFYRAWSVNSTGGISVNYAQSSIGGIGVSLIAEQLEIFANLLNSGLLVLSGVVIIIPVAIFSVLAFWKENAVLFMVASGMAMMTGLSTPNILSGVYTTTTLSLTIGLILITYSFLCGGFAIRLMFWKE